MTAPDPSLIRASRTPFHFNTSAHLLRITQFKSSNLTEFLAGLRECPEGSIFQHSFRTLQEHHFIREGFSNDFAQWVQSACNQPELAKELAGVDVREFTSLTTLRQRFIQIVENFLEGTPGDGTRSARRPFYFCLSDIVVMPTASVAHTLRQFIDGLKQVSIHSIHHHFIEARLRLQRLSNDFSLWLEQDSGRTEAALRLQQIDIYKSTLEDVRRQIIQIVEASPA